MAPLCAVYNGAIHNSIKKVHVSAVSDVMSYIIHNNYPKILVHLSLPRHSARLGVHVPRMTLIIRRKYFEIFPVNRSGSAIRS